MQLSNEVTQDAILKAKCYKIKLEIKQACYSWIILELLK